MPKDSTKKEVEEVEEVEETEEQEQEETETDEDQEQSKESKSKEDDNTDDDTGDGVDEYDDDEDEPVSLSKSQRSEYATQMRTHNRKAAAIRSALKNNRPLVEDDSERQADRLQKMEDRARRTAVKGALVDASISPSALELVLDSAKFDDYQELRNPKEIVKIAKQKIKALTPTSSSSSRSGKSSSGEDVDTMPGSNEEGSSKPDWFKVADNFL